MIATRDSIGADGGRAELRPAHERAPNGCWVSARKVVLGLGCLGAAGAAVLAILTYFLAGVPLEFRNDSSMVVTAIVVDSIGDPIERIDAVAAGKRVVERIFPRDERPLGITFVDASGAAHTAVIDGYALPSLTERYVVVFDGSSVSTDAR